MGRHFIYPGHQSDPDPPAWSNGGYIRFLNRLAEAMGTDRISATTFRSHSIFDFLRDNRMVLQPEMCREIAPKLRELVAKWDDGDYDREMAEKLAAVMEECAAENEELRYS